VTAWSPFPVVTTLPQHGRRNGEPPDAALQVVQRTGPATAQPMAPTRLLQPGAPPQVRTPAGDHGVPGPLV